MKDHNYSVRYKTELYDLFFEVAKISKTGEYVIPENMDGNDVKQLLCSLSGVGLYIEQQKKARECGENIGPIYDNTDEYNILSKAIENIEQLDLNMRPKAFEQMKKMFEGITTEYELSMKQKEENQKSDFFQGLKADVQEQESVVYSQSKENSELNIETPNYPGE